MVHLIFVCFALAATFAAAFGQNSCTAPKAAMLPTRRYDPEGQRIVGGQEARPGSHPWIVSLQNGQTHFCGGTLVAPDTVITAAHCVSDGPPDRIVAGAHQHYTMDKNIQASRPKTVTKHPQYHEPTTMNDIAIIKLATPFKLNDRVQVACLPADSEKVPDNTTGVVAGWGLTREGGYQTSDTLLQVGIPTISSDKCARAYRAQGIVINPTVMLCGGYERGGKDSCQGDSGGPFVFKKPDGSYTLQGVVSFGVGCARPGLPGVYARVSSYIKWISSVASLG